jgi:hypothetical protein
MDLPPWASWSYPETYLPAEFHTKAGFDKAKALLLEKPNNNRSLHHLLLGIGLAIRDICAQQEIEPDTQPDGVPEWVLQSELSILMIDSLLSPHTVKDRYVFFLIRCTANSADRSQSSSSKKRKAVDES